MQETEVNTHVELLLLLVCQLGVGNLIEVGHLLLLLALWTPGDVGVEDRTGVRHEGRNAVGGQRVGKAESSMRQHVVGLFHPTLHPCFLMSIPGSRHVPRGQPTRAAALTKTVRALVTTGEVDGVTTLIRIATAHEVSQVASPGLREALEGGTFFLCLLRELRSQQHVARRLVVDAVSCVILSLTVHLVGFHTSEEVHDVRIVPNLVVLNGATELQLFHRVVVADGDTADRHHRNGQ